jgi:hypothetical protein
MAKAKKAQTAKQSALERLTVAAIADWSGTSGRSEYVRVRRAELAKLGLDLGVARKALDTLRAAALGRRAIEQVARRLLVIATADEP